MAQTARTITLSASPEATWKVISDPDHLPRWWPGVTRVENVTSRGFTTVMSTRQGKPVRLDHTVVVSERPSRRAWEQELIGTPFERLLSQWLTTLTLEPDASGCRLTINERQSLRGSFKLGYVLQLRPARKRLDQALSNLQQILG